MLTIIIAFLCQYAQLNNLFCNFSNTIINLNKFIINLT